MAVLARLLHRKHSLQNTKHINQGGIGQNPQTFNQTISIDYPQLISHHVAIFVVKSVRYTKWIMMPAHYKWSSYKCAKVGIQFIW